MKERELHPLPLRLWHWVNAAIVIGLIATGLYLRRHGIAALTPHDPVLLWHKGLGLAMVAAILFWWIYTLSSRNRRRQYAVGRSDLKSLFLQARFYLFSPFTGEKDPFTASIDQKYNPLQKTAYGAVTLLVLPAQALTGLSFMDMEPLRNVLLSANLMGILDAVHVLFTYGLVLYLIVHLYMATLGERVFSHTKAMIVGSEEIAVGSDEGRLT